MVDEQFYHDKRDDSTSNLMDLGRGGAPLHGDTFAGGSLGLWE